MRRTHRILQPLIDAQLPTTEHALFVVLRDNRSRVEQRTGRVGQRGHGQRIQHGHATLERGRKVGQFHASLQVSDGCARRGAGDADRAVDVTVDRIERQHFRRVGESF